MNYKIIEKSEKWQTVPDEYAVKCIEEYSSLENEKEKILKFSFVQRAYGLIDGRFVQLFGTANIPSDSEGIIILINTTSFSPNFYLVNGDIISYAGQLNRCEIVKATRKAPNFSKVYYFSAKNIKKQKSDENAPEWLKDFAKRFDADVAYFKF